MKTHELIERLNESLKNEYKHMHFYLLSSVMVQGLHREELSEFLHEESLDEHKHCCEFAKLVVHLGGVPTTEVNPFPIDLTAPLDILQYVVRMEQEVADNYAKLLHDTDDHSNTATDYVHLFIENQLLDSQETAWEVQQMLIQYDSSAFGANSGN